MPLATAFGVDDNVTGGMQPLLEGGVPGASGQTHRSIEGAGHFIQEHQPAACVEAILDLLTATA